MTDQRTRLLIASVVLALCALPASAAARRNLPGFSSNVLDPVDDFDLVFAPTPHVNMGFSINIFGASHSTVWINNNGNLTFDGPLLNYTNFTLASTGRKILAPFFADVDTRGAASGVVTWGTGTVNGRPAFGVEWPGVGYFSAADNKLNTFEIVIIDRSDIAPGDFDLEYNYDSVQWETGDGNGGVNGLGGSSARVGFTAGVHPLSPNALELTGSAVNGALVNGGPNALISHSLNSTVPGRYIFWVRNTPPGPTPAGAPAATVPVLMLTGIMLIGMVWYLRLRAA